MNTTILGLLFFLLFPANTVAQGINPLAGTEPLGILDASGRLRSDGISYTGHIVFGKPEHLSQYGALGIKSAPWMKFGLVVEKGSSHAADELIRRVMFSSKDFSTLQFLKRGDSFLEKRIVFDYRASSSLSFGVIIPSADTINSFGGIGPRIKYSDGNTIWGGGIFINKSGQLQSGVVYSKTVNIF